MPTPWTRNESPASRLRNWKMMAEGADYQPGRLANLCGVSLRQLERQFQGDLGESPSQWLRRERMERAKKVLLRLGSATETAMVMGFSQLSHFSREFKRVVGTSPKAWLDSSANCRSG